MLIKDWSSDVCSSDLLRPVEGGIAFPGVREVVGMECEGATSAEWPFMSFDFPGGIGHPGLRSLYDYWENLRAGRAMPLRREFDTLHIPALQIGRAHV